MSRILIVIPTYPSYRAFLQGLADWLSERGWEVHVATNTSGANVGADAAKIHSVDMPRGAKPLQLWRASRQLSKLVREIEPAVVHAHFSVGILVLALASRIKGVRRLGTFQGMRFSLASGLERVVFKLVECFSILRMDRSWVLTEDDYQAVPKVIRSNLAVQDGYGFGCDVEHFNPKMFTENANQQLRASLGIGSADRVFIFVGRLTAFKGFDLALRAFQRVRETCEDVHLLVVGEFDPLHPLSLPDLTSIEGVHPVGWQDDPAPYLAISDAMFFPSAREGVPVCVMEAIAMSVPVIAREVRGVELLLRNFQSGRLLLPDRLSREGVVDALSQRMLSIPSDCDTSHMCGNARSMLARTRFYEFCMTVYAEAIK